MSLFPPTSLTLLQKLAVEVTGGNEASWVRFFGLYTPAIRRFVELNDHVHDPDDVVQEVYLKLVGILRSGKFDSDKARFRTFLALLIRHQLIALYRQDQARHVADRCSLDDLTDELAVPPEQREQIDLTWAKAKHEAAVEHVLTKVAMKAQSRDIYRAYVVENRPIEEVSVAYGVSPDIIYKVKYRVEKMIEAVETEYTEEN
ncbi:MAG: sigma-70 family RNA polymerase sigma factor [Kiritimatiellae bacterium]|nr:sigma-70 family RNA polymerase sigma factor [Kiritimatiellia bacterium]